MKKTILYFYIAPSTFVKKDILIFEQDYRVIRCAFNPKPKYFTPFVFLKQLIFLLVSFWKSEIIICQFGGYHSFLPILFAKIFGKPSLIISGGTDCVSFPSIRYGNFYKKLLGFFTRLSFRWASHIAPVHQCLMLSEYTYQDSDYPRQGLLFFAPDIKTPYTVVPNGYDSSKWRRDGEKKPSSFLTVAAGLKMPFSKKLKGIDLILGVAAKFPDCRFVIVGADQDDLEGCELPNVETVPFVPNDQLPRYYSEAEFYMQLSISEGFPNALSEAMLCECIPIVSNVGAMPELISDSGFVLMKRDFAMLQEVIVQSLKSDKKVLGARARSIIAQGYPESKRKIMLYELIEKLLAS